MRKSTKPSKSVERNNAKASVEAAAQIIDGSEDIASRVRLDGIEHDVSDFNEKSRAILLSLRFAETRLFELRNELAVCQTAQIAYLNALKLVLPVSVEK